MEMKVKAFKFAKLNVSINTASSSTLPVLLPVRIICPCVKRVQCHTVQQSLYRKLVKSFTSGHQILEAYFAVNQPSYLTSPIM